MEAKQKMKIDIVLVHWIDSHTVSGWVRETELNGALNCITIGFLVSSLKDRIVVAQSRDSLNGNWCNIIEIPNVAVLKTKKILQVTI